MDASPDVFAHLSTRDRFSQFGCVSFILIFVGALSLVLSLYKVRTPSLYDTELLNLSTRIVETQLWSEDEQEAILLFLISEYDSKELRLDALNRLEEAKIKGRALIEVEPELEKFIKTSKSHAGSYWNYKRRIDSAFKIVLASNIDSSVPNVENPKSGSGEVNVDEAIIVYGILALLGLVYILSTIIIFVSRRAEIVKMADNMVKTLTGFFIGIITSLLGLH